MLFASHAGCAHYRESLHRRLAQATSRKPSQLTSSSSYFGLISLVVEAASPCNANLARFDGGSSRELGSSKVIPSKDAMRPSPRPPPPQPSRHANVAGPPGIWMIRPPQTHSPQIE